MSSDPEDTPPDEASNDHSDPSSPTEDALYTARQALWAMLDASRDDTESQSE